MHLLVDGFGGDSEKLKSQEFVYKFLDKFPSSIDMNKISGPHVTTYNGPVEQDWGVSGFVMIAESHISIHTFPQAGLLSADIYSCKPFNVKLALDHFTKVFNPTAIKKNILSREIQIVRETELMEV